MMPPYCKKYAHFGLKGYDLKAITFGLNPFVTGSVGTTVYPTNKER